MAWGLLIMLFLYGPVLQAPNPICLRPSQLNAEFMAWGLLIMLFVYGLRRRHSISLVLDRLS